MANIMKATVLAAHNHKSALSIACSDFSTETSVTSAGGKKLPPNDPGSDSATTDAAGTTEGKVAAATSKKEQLIY